MTASPHGSRILKIVAFATLLGLALVGFYAILAPYLPDRHPRNPALPSPAASTLGAGIKPESIDLLSGQQLLDEMRRGKLVFFMRHFHTDHRTFHEDPIKTKHLEMTLEDFKNTGVDQRHLTDYGRARAKTVGESLKNLGIPVDHVVSSPYIRAVEGATLLAGRPPDLITKDLLHRGGGWTAEMMVDKIKPYLTTAPESGNILLMSHRPQMDAISPIQEGQMFVFRPTGNGAFHMIGAIHDTDWLEAQVSIDNLGRRYAEFTSQGEDK